MRLQEGQAAPDFTTVDVRGESISLDAYKGKFLLVSFFRYAGCPFCNITLIKLIERYDNFVSRGMDTVVFFQSSDESINTYASIKNPPFPLIADPAKHVYDKYGVESSKIGALRSIPDVPATVAAILRGDVVQGKLEGDQFLMPAQFIIDPEGKIVKAHYGSDYSDKIPLFEIEEIILTKIPGQHI